MNNKLEQMSTKELTDYVLKNRHDLEAIDQLVNRRSPDEEATWYNPMITSDGEILEDNIRIAEEAIRERVKALEKKKQQ